MAVVKISIDYGYKLIHHYTILPRFIKRDPCSGIWKLHCVDHRSKAKMVFRMDTIKGWDHRNEVSSPLKMDHIRGIDTYDFDLDSDFGSKLDL
jgi:hypothetical protein